MYNCCALFPAIATVVSIAVVSRAHAIMVESVTMLELLQAFDKLEKQLVFLARIGSMGAETTTLSTQRFDGVYFGWRGRSMGV